MRADVELTLVHDGREWIVANDSFRASGKTFEALDTNLINVIRDTGIYKKGSRVSVFMGYDFDTFPTWLRQYHSHYFNRQLEIEL